MLEVAFVSSRAAYHGRRLGSPGQHRRRETHPLLKINSHLVELMADGPLLGHGQMRLAHQPLDKVAIATIRRDSPRRGMGLNQVAVLLEHGHLIAYGSRANPQAIRFDSLGANRLGR